MHPTYSEACPLPFEDQALYLVEGTLTELQVARTTVNLLEQIDRNIQSKSVAAGAAAVLSGMHGVVANSAAVALYDGEETYNFAALLGEQVICGTFQHADKMEEGDRVKAVVSKRGDALFAHAIMNAKTQEFYMPLNVFSGSDGLFGHCMRVAVGFTIFLWVIFLAFSMLSGIFNTPSASASDKFFLAIMFFFGPPLIMFPFELWTYYSMRGDKSDAGDTYGTAIFKVFGFPQADKVDLLRDCRLSDGSNGGWDCAWRADKLLEKHKA